MRRFHFHAAALVLSLSASVALHGQSGFDKRYPVSGRPGVQVDVDDAAVRIQGCGGCNSVHVRLDTHGADMSQWRMNDLQGGNSVHITLKHRERGNWTMNWHNRAPEVIVETPGDSDVTVRSGDGGLSVSQVRGAIDLRTGDGGVQVSDTAGSLRLSTGDGGIQVSRAEGTLSASTGDGGMSVEGRFSQIDTRSGDGSMRISLLPGSVLQSSSRISTGDGSIQLTVPRDLRMDLEASSGDGSIACNLPMLSRSSDNSRHTVRGSLNGGGPVMRVQSGDGSIAISSR